MRKRKSSSKKNRLILLIILALLCIGAFELIACSYFAPALYLQITAPVRRGFHAAKELGAQIASGISASASSGLSRLSAWWSEVTAPDEEEPPQEVDFQLASDAAIASNASILDPAITELKQDGELEILTGGIMEIIYYNQADEAWAQQPYGSDHIGGYGCGPTTMAMVVSSMTEQTIDPAQMAKWAADNRYWAKGSGSYHSIVEGASAAYGLKAEPISEYTPEAIREAMISGKLLVALMGPGHFTQGGHFILLRGLTLTGSLLVADPNSRERSLMEWDSELIIGELSSRYSNGGPLWVISQFN